VGGGGCENDGHSIDIEMEVSMYMQCTGVCKVQKSEQQTKHLLQYVCTVVHSAQSHGRLLQHVWSPIEIVEETLNT